MLRLSGALLILLASLLFGLSSVLRLRERVCLLGALKLFVMNVRRELSVAMPELRELFSMNENERTKPITDMIASAISSGEMPHTAVENAFSSQYAKRLLKPDEREYLAKTLSTLGSGDLQSAEETLGYLQAQLELYTESAAEEERKNSKVSLAVSAYIGLAAMILMM